MRPGARLRAAGRFRRMIECVFPPQGISLMIELVGKSVEELRALAESWGEPAYRGDQLYHALYAERRFDISQITNLPADLRARLAAETTVRLPRIARKYLSTDGSIRYLLSLEGEAGAPVQVEAVFMPDVGEHARRQTICISTQA